MSGSQTPGVSSSDSEATSVSKNDGNNASSTSSDDGEKCQQYKLLLHPASKPKILRPERMSRAQARIWFVSRYLPDQAAYNMVFHYCVARPLNMMRLRHALQATTHYYKCLRMCFSQRVRDGRPVQDLLASSAFELEHVAVANKDDFKQAMDKFETRVWDIKRGKTLGITSLFL
ncbi:hypothetical protein QIS74_08550 [Colletotrichum tabaci]|uniref:Condensation domain-containing protein n=1 Tax=Colletotrichum tabaci TaxID=1209068 RepID=A0AAV9T818_9PEZI